MPSQDPHLEHYRRELRYLRTESAHFAARYPKLAQRLVLTDAESADPHIQHLIESVAFLTAGVHRELWFHEQGDRSWLVVTRNTVTHEILGAELARDVKKGGAA